MKDKDNVLRNLDEIDNMIQIINNSVQRGINIDRVEAVRRFGEIRRKLKFVSERVSLS